MAAMRILFLPHAVRQMARPDRMITAGEVRSVVQAGVIIEEYANDPRGLSALILGHGAGSRPVHVVAAPKTGYLATITAYLPDPAQWDEQFAARRKSK